MTLLRRARTLPSTRGLQKKEEAKVRQALQRNGYTEKAIARAGRAVEKSIRRGPRQEPDTQPSGFVTLPYIAGVTERLARILRSRNVCVTEKPHRTLRSQVVHPKNPVDSMDKRGAVYKVECGDCDAKYIGETKRTARVRISEHQRALRLDQPEKSAVAEHALQTLHDINWTGVEVIAHEEQYWKRRVKEAIAIQKNQASMNRDNGLDIPPQYIAIL